MQRAKRIVEGKYKPTIREKIISPSYQDVLVALKNIEKDGLDGRTIDFDIEIYNEEVSCISFSLGDNRAISVPFVFWNGHYFDPEEELDIWILIARILENSKIRKRGQNLSFDSHFLLRRYGIKVRSIDDTMVAQRIIMPDYPIGLDFITSIWTDHPYYKAEGKRSFSGGRWKQ